MSELELHFYYYIFNGDDLIGLLDTTDYLNAFYTTISGAILIQITYAEFGTMMAIEEDLPVLSFNGPRDKSERGLSDDFVKLLNDIEKLRPEEEQRLTLTEISQGTILAIK